MEDKKGLLESLKELEDNETAEFDLLNGLIIKVEEIEYNKFKLAIRINSNEYDGIYVDFKSRPKEGDIVIFDSVYFIKKDRNIYLYLKEYMFKKNKNNANVINQTYNPNNKNNIYDLSPNHLIQILMKIEPKKVYNSNIFIFKQKNKGEILLVPINEKHEISINKRPNKEFDIFLSKNNIKENDLIYIDNYIYEKENISFNHLTLFNIAKCEYIDKYFQKQLIINTNYIKTNSIFSYIKNFNKKQILDSIFLKVIEINDNFVLAIDHEYCLYKLYNINNKKNKLDLYNFIFIKNYTLRNDDDIFYILIISDSSLIYIFENTFYDSILNDLTVLYFNIIDLKEPIEDNYYSTICLENYYINYFSNNFNINRKSEYFIINTKSDIFYNYYPIEIKLINNEEIDSFKFILYYGILNKVNCYLNNKSPNKYSLEYFYFNFSNKLPDFHEEEANGIHYKIKDSDIFNNKTRKRFIIINSPNNQFTEIYDIKKNEIKEESKKRKEMNKTGDIKNKEEKLVNNEENKINEKPKTNEEKDRLIENNPNNLETNKLIEDIKTDEDYFLAHLIIEKMHDSLHLCFLYKNNEKHLLGIYDIEEIIFYKKDNYNPPSKYDIFYDYFENIKNDNNNDSEYLNNLKKYENDKDLEKLVLNKNYDFSNIKYKDYLIYINLCLFYYMSKTEYKKNLLSKFEQNLNLLLTINLTIEQKIRIIKFTCEEYIKSLTEGRESAKLILISTLPENNSYKIAFNYCKKIISEINENSKLYLPFLQLDNYILFNYYIKSYSYTLSLEPLNITKKHLLLLYEDFIFTYKEKQKENIMVLAFQHFHYDVTAINEYALFHSYKSYPSYLLTGEDLAIPIVMEFLHEKKHFKKDKKNKRCQRPLYFYKKSTLLEVDKEFRDINDKSGKKGEAGLLVEYFIRYKKKSLVKELKFNHCFGDIIKNIKFFTSKNFELLYQEISQSKKKTKTIGERKVFGCSHFDKKKLINNTINNIKNKDNGKNTENGENNSNNDDNNKDLGIEFYEKQYLLEGKYFIYPDSIPYICIPYDNKDHKIPQGLIDFMKKYKTYIEKGRKMHYQ